MQTLNQPTIEIENVTLPAKRRRPWWRLAIEGAAVSVAAIAALEGFFAVAKVGQQEFLEPDTMLGCQHIPGKVVTWRLEGFSNDRLTDSGLRDVEHAVAKPAGTVRIALLGDSATEGLQVDLNQTFARVLERGLNAKAAVGSTAGAAKAVNYEVINFGCSSYSTGQQLLQFKRDVAKYKPDVVVLLYNRGDSIENVFTPGPGVLQAPRPYFYLDANQKLQVDDAVMKGASSKLRPSSVLSFLRRNSRIYGVFTQTNLALSLNEPRYRKLAALWAGFTGRFEKNDGPSTWSVPYAKQDSVAVTAKLIDELQHDIEDNGAKLVLMMFPNSVNDPEYQQQEIKFEKIFGQGKTPYLNLTQPFVSSPDVKANFLQFHFSAQGHQLVAEKLQPVIESILVK